MNLSRGDLNHRLAIVRSKLTWLDSEGYVRWNFNFFWIVACLSFSCQKGDVEQQTQMASYEVDTVLIDSKGRILDLAAYMQASDLSSDGSSFFLYNHHDLSIDEINLDRKEFVKSYFLEAEGPNGVGQFIFGLQVLDDSLMFVKSVPFSSIINRKGQVVQKVNWLAAKDTNGVQLDIAPPRMEAVVNIEDYRVMGTNLDFRKKTAFLGVFSVSNNQATNVDIDPEKSFSNYFLNVDNNFRDPWVFLRADSRQVYVSHEYSNEIILLNPEGEIVKVVHYEPTLTSSRANVPQILTGTSEQINKETRKLLEQVRFEAPVWDSVNNRYFRLSAKRIFGETGENPTPPRTRVFLTVFDASFNLVSEMEFEELYDEQFKYFVKDGKLWVCQNFSDELGFLVFDF